MHVDFYASKVRIIFLFYYLMKLFGWFSPRSLTGSAKERAKRTRILVLSVLRLFQRLFFHWSQQRQPKAHLWLMKQFIVLSSILAWISRDFVQVPAPMIIASDTTQDFRFHRFNEHLCRIFSAGLWRHLGSNWGTSGPIQIAFYEHSQLI